MCVYHEFDGTWVKDDPNPFWLYINLINKICDYWNNEKKIKHKILKFANSLSFLGLNFIVFLILNIKILKSSIDFYYNTK